MKMRLPRFAKLRLHVAGKQDMAPLLALAIKERLTRYEIDALGLQNAVKSFFNGDTYKGIFERTHTELFEMSALDRSCTKYTLGSKYYLTRNLGALVEEKQYADMVLEAYDYLIQKIIARFRGCQRARLYRAYKRYIQFDTINNIFKMDNMRQIRITAQIYKTLRPRLASDYQFLRQYAKCYLRFARITSGKDEKCRLIDEALGNIKQASSNATALSHPDRPEITAHMRYTHAAILCARFDYYGGNDKQMFEDAVNCLFDALLALPNASINRNNLMNGNRRSLNVISFIKQMGTKATQLQVTSGIQHQINEIASLSVECGIQAAPLSDEN